MANPKSRHSKSRQAKRRANWKGQMPNTVECPECNEAMISHTVCPSCGTYKGKKILEVVEKD
jgi:large subunit ribosomal protein L32